MRFFRTGPGQYGEGDKFIGVKVPTIRQIAREYRDMPLKETKKLLQSAIHEERLLALIILVLSLNKCTAEHRQEVYDFYCEHIQHVNNWDLVDSSAPAIVGGYLYDKSRRPLVPLAKAKDIWKRRIAIVSTQHFIRLGQFNDTLAIGQLLLNDQEDLIHKATGWMLREVGERDVEVLEKFLQQHAAIMPRTMLRYAIEKLPSTERQKFLKR